MWNMRCVDCRPESSHSLSFSPVSMVLGIGLSVTLIVGGAVLAMTHKEQIPKVLAFGSICLAQFGPINLVRSLRVDFSEVVRRFSSYGEKVSANPLDLINLACWAPDGTGAIILNFLYLVAFSVLLNVLYIFIIALSLCSPKGAENVRKVTMVFLSLGLPQGIKSVNMAFAFLRQYADVTYLCKTFTDGNACGDEATFCVKAGDVQIGRF